MYLISDFLSRHLIDYGEYPYEIIPIAFQLIEEIMRIEENEKFAHCMYKYYTSVHMPKNYTVLQTMIRMYFIFFAK